jgi:hypothetical protein
MTDLRDHRPLSRVELTVLARLSAANAPTALDIGKSLSGLGMSLAKPALMDCVTATLAALRDRALLIEVVTSSPGRKPGKTARARPSKRKVTPRFILTESGRIALRSAFDLKITPTWRETCDSVVPAVALGLSPGSKVAVAALRSTEAMMAILLRRDRGLGEALTLNQLCDQIIARTLGMPPGLVTLAGLRAFALSMHCGVDKKADLVHLADCYATTKPVTPAKPDRELQKRATDWAQKRLDAKLTTKSSMVNALQRYWITQQDEADVTHVPSPLWPATALSSQVTPSNPPISNSSHALTPEIDTLLVTVLDAIPRIGLEGRYGKENVFVSALWQHIARDRATDLPLDRFKRWLVTANRQQLLDLARADLVDAMDAKLVEQSEIEDLGATFHFVVDRQALPSTQAQASHAR